MVGDAPAGEARRVFEKLRVSLSRFAGPDGFIALARRSLALARSDNPLLGAVSINRDGLLEGFEQATAGAGIDEADAGIAIIGHFLDLLVTFVGEPITVRLVREAWPDAPLSKSDRGWRV